MRLFIAILLDDAVRKELTGAQTAMRKYGVRGNYSPENNLHLTLAFIGEYNDPEAVSEAIDSVPFENFEIGLEGFGCFGDVWWAGIKRSDELAAYVKRLRKALADANIPFDGKKFTPHITLLRRAECGRPLDGLMSELPETKAMMTVEHISLMRSERGKHSMIYTEIN